MRLLDLFCGAGGAAVGYARAGFEVVGVDIDPQPRYPFEIVRADAISYAARHAHRFDAVHASPPCQAYSVTRKAWNGRGDHPDLVAIVRNLLRQQLEDSGVPYVIENVIGAPLHDAVKLCGSMFDLAVERHRLFECSFPVTAPPCDHRRQRELWPGGFPVLRSGRSKPARVVGVFGTGGGSAKDLTLWKWAMGIDWMQTKHELAESIPPAYTEFIGRQLAAHLQEGK